MRTLELRGKALRLGANQGLSVPAALSPWVHPQGLSLVMSSWEKEKMVRGRQRKREKTIEEGWEARRARERKEHALGGSQPRSVPTCTCRLQVCDMHVSTEQLFAEHLL